MGVMLIIYIDKMVYLVPEDYGKLTGVTCQSCHTRLTLNDCHKQRSPRCINKQILLLSGGII